MNDNDFLVYIWHPQTADHKVPAHITWSPTKGATIKTLGSLFPIDDSINHLENIFHHPDDWEQTLWAKNSEGKSLTLFETSRTSRKSNLGQNPHTEEWISSWLIRGAHLDSTEQKVLLNASTTMEDLNAFVVDGRLGAPHYQEIDGVGLPEKYIVGETFILPFVLPVLGGERFNLRVGEGNGTRYSLSTFATRPLVTEAFMNHSDLRLESVVDRTRGGMNLRINIEARLAVESTLEESFSIAEAIEKINDFNRLMKIALFDSVLRSQISAKTIEGDRIVIDVASDPYMDPTEKSRGTNFVFDLQKYDLQSLLNEFFSLKREHQADFAMDIFTGIIGHNPRFVEEFASQSFAAIEGVSTWSLRIKNNTFREKITELYNGLSESIKELLSLDVVAWADQATYLRNHVDHGGTKNKKRDLDALQMKAIADTAHLITYLAVLEHLQITTEDICNGLITNPSLMSHLDSARKIQPLPLND